MEKQITWSIRFIALFICSLSFLNVHAQKNTNVKGTVYDSNNEPLVGATVSVKGNSSNGTITNIDGQFSLNVQDLKSTLVVSFVGYQTQEVALPPPMTLTRPCTIRRCRSVTGGLRSSAGTICGSRIAAMGTLTSWPGGRCPMT